MRSANPTSLTSSRGRRNRVAGRAMISTAGAALLVVATAAVASAHITVHSADAKPGGKNATLVFKVPNEESGAKTIKIEIDLPTDTPLIGVVPQTPAGWSAETRPDKIVFSGGAISGDNSVEFPIKVGQLPTVDMLMFNAIQTYSDGNVVRWTEMGPAGAPEPAHQMPMLDLKNPSALSADEIADAKADAAKAAKADAPKSASSAPATAKPASAPATAKPASAPATAKPSSAPTAAPTHAAVATPADTSSPAMPKVVHAGSGGQASERSDEFPAAPAAVVVLGLGVAAVAARRLNRG